VPNRLANETSPYLLQHADNPVDWYPWGEEALQRAVDEDKPILLSVGYSACHWCHVMERESFTDESIAALMNEHFVNIKVDREERPDVDELYMRSVQAFQQGRGGWPMTVFLTPSGEPFFGGTYFPPTPRHGMPAFRDVLVHIRDLYRDDRDRVRDITVQVTDLLEVGSDLPGSADGVQGGRWLDAVVAAAAGQFDAQHGGFGSAPKFPSHGLLAALLAHGHATGSDASVDMALLTLDRMAQGGMFDLVGGGFARYSVDPEWRVPHFEKMLYDNAQLVPLYVAAWQITGAERFEWVVRRTVGWVLDEMQLDEGGFAASLDADSEGEEGRYFVWDPEQLEELFGPDDASRLCALLGVTPMGSFEHGTSVLRLERPLHQLDRRERALVDRALKRLKVVRRGRVAPGRDDKVITAWNGLMISALARASAALDEPEWLAAASVAADFLRSEVTVDGRLMRTYKDDRAHLPAYADDHAALLLAFLDLYEASFDRRWLDHAAALAEQLLELFWDDDGGGLYYTGSDVPELVVRSKHALGGAEPSANGMAALAFARMDSLMGRTDLGQRADTILRRLADYLEQAPVALGIEAIAGAWRATAGHQIVLAGDPDEAEGLIRAVRQRYEPFAVLAATRGGDDSDDPRLPLLEGKEPLDDSPAAYVCEGMACQLPVTGPDDLVDQLEATARDWAAVPTPEPQRPAGPLLPRLASVWLGAPPDRTGRVTVLCFLTTTRAGCQHALDELEQLAQQLREEPVAVVAVHTGKFPGELGRAAAHRAFSRHHVSFPVLLDPERTVFEAVNARTWPTFLVLDAHDRVAFRRAGEVRAASLVPLLRQLVAEAGGLPTVALPTPTIPAHDDPLTFPERVHVFPDALMQELGANPFEGGLLYVSDTCAHRILELELSLGDDGWPEAQLLRTFGSGRAGLSDGAAEVARFRRPHGLCRSSDDLYVADTGNHAVRAVSLATGEVRTVLGTGELGRGRPRGRLRLDRPTRQPIRSPLDVEVLEMKGAVLVFVAMGGSHQVWVWANGHAGLFAGSGVEDHIDGPAADAALAMPSGLGLFGRYLLFVDAQTGSVRGVDLQHHQVVTVVGQGLDDHGDRDGRGEQVRLQFPRDLTFHGEAVYIADAMNDKIKRIELATLQATTVGEGPTGDDPLCRPGGIDRMGNFLVVADTDNHRICSVRVSDGARRELPINGL